MSWLTKKDLHTPFNSLTILKLIGLLQAAWHEQTVAATAAGAAMVNGTPARHAGSLRSLYLISADPAAAGESLTVDVKVNGATVLTAPFAFNATQTANIQIELPLDPAKKDIAVGDLITVDRTYVAGGGPTMSASVVSAEWA